MKTFKIISKTETIVTRTYYVDAESKEAATKLWNDESIELDLQDTDENEGIECMESIVETDKDGNDL